MIDQIEKRPPATRPEPMTLDMGLGSREQGFPLQNPKLTLAGAK